MKTHVTVKHLVLVSILLLCLSTAIATGAGFLTAYVMDTPGATGAIGAIGAQGEQGPRGVHGERGKHGKRGRVGKDGATGTAGSNGTNSVSECSNDPSTYWLPYC